MRFLLVPVSVIDQILLLELCTGGEGEVIQSLVEPPHIVDSLPWSSSGVWCGVEDVDTHGAVETHQQQCEHLACIHFV